MARNYGGDTEGDEMNEKPTKEMTDEEFIKYMKENFTNHLVRNNRKNVYRMAKLYRMFL